MSHRRPKYPVRPLVISRADVNRSLCPSNKRSYTTEQGAEQARQDIYRKTQNVQKYYTCRDCKRYHLSSQIEESDRQLFLAKMKRKNDRRSPDAWRAPKPKRKGWYIPEFEALMLEEEEEIE